METISSQNSARVISDLRELAKLTATPDGAQRLAWGPVWRKAREWFHSKVQGMGLEYEMDAAGNNWFTLKGKSEKTVILGSHLDSVPDGGWLDGCLGVLAALEALRLEVKRGVPPVTIKLVDWADEEGARYGRSLFGSSAAANTLDLNEVRDLVDRQGVKLVDALKENGIELNSVLNAHPKLKKIDAKAYLELHIEQGPTLESLGRPTGVVLGTKGVERHSFRFVGQAAHSGSTPIHLRRDAFLAAAEFALRCREIAKRHLAVDSGAVGTNGVIKAEPGIVTAIPGVCEISLDQRSMDASVLARMFEEAKLAAEECAKNQNVSVESKLIWRIAPRLFDPTLIKLCEEAVRETCGDAPKLPSGALHDAAEMVPFMPTVMMFAYSTKGLSHCKEEDTPEEHLDLTIRAFLKLVEKTIKHVAS